MTEAGSDGDSGCAGADGMRVLSDSARAGLRGGIAPDRIRNWLMTKGGLSAGEADIIIWEWELECFRA